MEVLLIKQWGRSCSLHYPIVLVSLRWFKQGQCLPAGAALLFNRMGLLFEGAGNRCGGLNDA